MLLFKPIVSSQLTSPDEVEMVLELIRKKHITHDINEILVSISAQLITRYVDEIFGILHMVEPTADLIKVFTNILHDSSLENTERFVKNFIVECEHPQIAQQALCVQPSFLIVSDAFALSSFHRLLERATFKNTGQLKIFSIFVNVFYQAKQHKTAIDKLDVWRIVTSENYGYNIDAIRKFFRLARCDIKGAEPVFDVPFEYNLEHVIRIRDLNASFSFAQKFYIAQFVDAIRKTPEKTQFFIEAIKICLPEIFSSQRSIAISEMWILFALVPMKFHEQVYGLIIYTRGTDKTQVHNGVAEFAKCAHLHDDVTNLEKIRYFSRYIPNWAQYRDVLTEHISREKLETYGLHQIFSEML